MINDVDNLRSELPTSDIVKALTPCWISIFAISRKGVTSIVSIGYFLLLAVLHPAASQPRQFFTYTGNSPGLWSFYLTIVALLLHPIARCVIVGSVFLLVYYLIHLLSRSSGKPPFSVASWHMLGWSYHGIAIQLATLAASRVVPVTAYDLLAYVVLFYFVYFEGEVARNILGQSRIASLVGVTVSVLIAWVIAVTVSVMVFPGIGFLLQRI